MKFASKVGPANPEESAVQAKCLKFFILESNADLSLEMA